MRLRWSAAVLKASRSDVRTFSRVGWFHPPGVVAVAAAGLRHRRAPPDGFRQPLRLSTVQKVVVRISGGLP